ncbi:MAG: hypothetical protein WDO70_04300 [Alphaproteobacteria bacterium]
MAINIALTPDPLTRSAFRVAQKTGMTWLAALEGPEILIFDPIAIDAEEKDLRKKFQVEGRVIAPNSDLDRQIKKAIARAHRRAIDYRIKKLEAPLDLQADIVPMDPASIAHQQMLLHQHYAGIARTTGTILPDAAKTIAFAGARANFAAAAYRLWKLGTSTDMSQSETKAKTTLIKAQFKAAGIDIASEPELGQSILEARIRAMKPKKSSPAP